MTLRRPPALATRWLIPRPRDRRGIRGSSPVKDAGTDDNTGPWNATIKNPILVMGITNDPNTTFASARRVAHLFGNAALLAQQGYGHGTYTDPSACVDAAMGRYLVHLVTPPRGTVCRSDRQPFDPHFGEPPGADEVP